MSLTNIMHFLPHIRLCGEGNMQNDSHTDHQAVEMLWYMVLVIYTRQSSIVKCSGWPGGGW